MGVKASSIAANIEQVRERIELAAARAGRRAEGVKLVAVSKTFPAAAIREAYVGGIRDFGENRVQEWEGKQPLVADLDAAWHLVGHLQSNKARRAAQLFHTIDSLDGIGLAQKLDRAAGELNTRLAVLIEVRLAPEETKSGVSEADLPRLAEAVVALPRLELRGLMVLPPWFDNPEHVRPYFRRLRELRDALRRRLRASGACHSESSEVRFRDSDGVRRTPEIGESFLPELSMGMSQDFEVAIEEGATQIRLGTAIFGPRAG
jgi:pyridoxal phosphate enzyme (YggS family)